MIYFLHKYKYEILLFALIQHLFIGIVLTDMAFYTTVVWPINMIILGVASSGVFIEKGKWKNIIKNVLSFFAIGFPLCVPFWGSNSMFMLALNSCLALFYLFIFIEILRFLIKPSYINKDIITASACGYFLLIEISVFVFQNFYYANTSSFKGMEAGFSLENSAKIFMDLVYYCTITITSIGFGDITPNTHYTKLITSFLGITGQFYSVVLVGILISKFTSSNSNTE
jgi:Ion channel